MLVFDKNELCCTPYEDKVHIRRGTQTYCGRRDLLDLNCPGLIGITERAKELCRDCLSVFQASEDCDLYMLNKLRKDLYGEDKWVSSPTKNW